MIRYLNIPANPDTSPEPGHPIIRKRDYDKDIPSESSPYIYDLIIILFDCRECKFFYRS